VPASRKLGREEAQQLADAASRVVAAKGKNVVDSRVVGAGPEIVDAMLGPTGNLRAPTIRRGKTVVVGFQEELFEQLFG
jgi:hypothetical protein